MYSVYVRAESTRGLNALRKITLNYGPMRFKRLSHRVYAVGVEGSKVCSLCCVLSNPVASYTISEPIKHTEVLK
jgi:hypothetical protein